MHRDLGRRRLEDQPSVSDIDVLEAEHIAQERAIGVGVGAVDQKMRPVDHANSFGTRPAPGRRTAIIQNTAAIAALTDANSSAPSTPHSMFTRIDPASSDRLKCASKAVPTML